MNKYKDGTTLHHPVTGEKVGEIRSGWLNVAGLEGEENSIARKFISLCEIREPEEPFEKVGLEELRDIINLAGFEHTVSLDALRKLVEDYRKEQGK